MPATGAPPFLPPEFPRAPHPHLDLQSAYSVLLSSYSALNGQMGVVSHELGLAKNNEMYWMNEARGHGADSARFKGEVDELSTKIEGLREESDDLKRQLAELDKAAKKKEASLDQQLEKAMREVESKKKEINRLSDDVGKLSEQVKEATEKLSSEKRGAEETERKLREELQEAGKKLAVSMAEWQGKLDLLKKELEHAQELHRIALEEKGQLFLEKERAVQAAEEGNKKIEALTKEVGDLTKRLEEFFAKPERTESADAGAKQQMMTDLYQEKIRSQGEELKELKPLAAIFQKINPTEYEKCKKHLDILQYMEAEAAWEVIGKIEEAEQDFERMAEKLGEDESNRNKKRDVLQEALKEFKDAVKKIAEEKQKKGDSKKSLIDTELLAFQMLVDILPGYIGDPNLDAVKGIVKMMRELPLR